MRIRGQISIKGIVQGVGFRPFVYKTAHDLGMQGTVRNLGSEVVVLAEGDNFEEFMRRLSLGTPPSPISTPSLSPIQMNRFQEDLRSSKAQRAPSPVLSRRMLPPVTNASGTYSPLAADTRDTGPPPV